MKWKLGQIWKDRYDNKWRVVRVEESGMAWLEMFHPMHTRPLSQKPIPVDWTLVSED